MELKSKYEQALAKYNCNVDEAAVAAAVKKIVEQRVPKNDTEEVKKFLLGSVCMTTLTTQDSAESVLKLVEKVNKFSEEYPNLPHVATVVTYPRFAQLVADSLEVEGVIPTVVSGAFPSSQALIEIKVAETKLAVQDGAENVDIVMHVGEFLSGDYETVCDEIWEQKAACGDVPMKVILETGDLLNLSNVKKASILSMYAGADYIKTSTGKEKVGATPEAVYVMCQAIKEYYDQTGIMVGLKPAGGINSVKDALTYYSIVEEVLGEKWLTNYYFRLGTSRLPNLILSDLAGKEVKFFTSQVAQDEVRQTAGTQTEEVVSEPLLTQDLLYDAVVGEGILYGIDTTCGLQTNHDTSLFVVLLDSLTHHIYGLRCSTNLLLTG